MKKLFAFTSVVCFALFSCQKEAATRSQDLSRTTSTSVSSSSAKGETIVTLDLTGHQFYNGCNNETMTVLTGTAILNIAPNGNIRETNVHNFVEQDQDGN